MQRFKWVGMILTQTMILIDEKRGFIELLFV